MGLSQLYTMLLTGSDGGCMYPDRIHRSVFKPEQVPQTRPFLTGSIILTTRSDETILRKEID